MVNKLIKDDLGEKIFEEKAVAASVLLEWPQTSTKLNF